MKVIRDPLELQKLVGDERLKGRSVGFVPTMGALHAGHNSLFEQAKKDNDVFVASIYVNETQFNEPSDLEKYPQPRDADLELLKKAGADFVFTPRYSDMYPDDYQYVVSEKKLSKSLCGTSRAGHFDGVLTVVMKLLQIVSSDRAYFGEKDFQQLMLIRGMCNAYFLPVEICAGATVREPDGLALSSRNVRLTPEERERAPQLYRVLSSASSSEHARKLLTEAGFTVDYVEEQWGRRLAAVFLGEVRLIDNVEV